MTIIKKSVAAVLLLAMVLMIPVYGEESAEEQTINGLQEELDYSLVEDFLQDTIQEDTFKFSEMVETVLQGDSQNVFWNFFQYLKNKILGELRFNTELLKKMILIGLFTAVFSNFSSVLKDNSISETGFFISYVLMITVLLSSYGILVEIVQSVLTTILDFMKALLPVYMVSLGLQLGQGGAASYYSIALTIISVVDYLSLHFFVPAIGIFLVFHLINNFSKEDFISKAADLIKRLVNYGITGLFAVITGMNVIQGMLLPVSGSIRNQAVSSVLGIMSGGMANNITNLAYGTASAVKSGIGTVGMLVIVALAIIPILKVVCFVFGYHVAAVLLQPVSDKRLIKSIEAVAEGAALLLKCIFLCTFTMLITIAIICMATGIS